MKKHHLFSLITLTVILIDQITKHFLNKLNIHTFLINVTHNTGAAFSLFQNQRTFLILISAIVIAYIIGYYKEIPKKLKIPAALILGGTIGNLIDRVLLGYVIDFIDLRIWPIFNLADSAIVIGAILVVIHLWKEKK